MAAGINSGAARAMSPEAFDVGVAAWVQAMAQPCGRMTIGRPENDPPTPVIPVWSMSLWSVTDRSLRGFYEVNYDLVAVPHEGIDAVGDWLPAANGLHSGGGQLECAHVPIGR